MINRLVIFFLFTINVTWLNACNPINTTPIPLTITQNYSKVLQTPTDSQTIRLANGFWAPYNGPDLPHEGCDSWVITEAFALEGFKVEYGFFPWARSYTLSATGQWDGTLSWDDTPEHRSQHYLSQKPTSLQEWVFFYRTDHPLIWHTLDDLAGKTLGVTTGYVYSDAFKDIQKKNIIKFVESSSDEANFKMLMAGRIDAFPIERQVGRYIIKTIFTPEEQSLITESNRSFAQYRSYLLLSKAVPRNTQMILLFNRGFEKLEASGRYLTIMQNCTS